MSCMPDARADGVVFGLRSGGSPSVNRQVQSAGAGLLSPALDLSVLSSLPAEAALGPPGGQRLRQLHLGSLIVWRTMCEQFEGSEVPSSRKSKQIRLGAGASVRGEHPVLAWRLGQGSLRVGAARGAGRGRARGSGGCHVATSRTQEGPGRGAGRIPQGLAACGLAVHHRPQGHRALVLVVISSIGSFVLGASTLLFLYNVY